MAELFKVWLFVNAGAFVVIAVISYFVSAWALDFLAYVDRRIISRAARPQAPAPQDDERPDQPIEPTDASAPQDQPRSP